MPTPAGDGRYLASAMRPATAQKRAKYRRYLRPECDHKHSCEYQAKSCCPRVIDAMYVCPECSESFHSAEEAMACEVKQRIGSAALSKTWPLKMNAYPVCISQAETLHDAIECCLRRTMSRAARFDLVRSVELGQLPVHDLPLH